MRQMKDYATIGKKLLWQRQMIFAAAIGLAAFYYSGRLALIILALILVSEVYDYRVFKAILRCERPDRRAIRSFMRQLYFGTFLSAGVIVCYVIGISFLQGPTTHFMPMFFLFAASLFAAMNNHQLLPVLMLRLVMYGATFLFIPIWDIIRTGASIQSELWTQLFTSIFVLYFIIDCSRIYLNFYRANVRSMDALRDEHEKTKQAFKVKTEFLSTMSHELRTPMTSIKGSLDLVNSGMLGELPPRVESTLAIAQRNCARLSALINEILDLQRIESGKMKFDFKSVDVGALVSQSAAANQPYASTYNVTIRTDLPVMPVHTRADQARLEQVMANLLSNAAKFSHDGGDVVIRVESSETGVRISVIDHGIGLEEADHDKVFDQFSQLDSSDQRKVGGTGLGMNITKRIVEAHGGTIGYVKNDGPGTTFHVDLERMQDPPDSSVTPFTSDTDGDGEDRKARLLRAAAG